MDFFIDKNEPAMYITTKRNGSTLLSEISTVVDNFERIQIPEFVNTVARNRSIPIYAPIRDPLVRFKSGLFVNLHNRSDFKFNNVDENALHLFRYMLVYFDNCTGETGKLVSTYPVRPFHLYDSHCDHWLGGLMILSALGFKLKPIRMNNLSKHLEYRFRQGIDFINNRERPSSFDKSKPDYEQLWEVYKEVFIERTPDHIQEMINNNQTFMTFDQWMKPEIDIFNMFLNYEGSELNSASHNCMNDYIDRQIYFNDLYSPNGQTVFALLEFLSNYKVANSKLDELSFIYQVVKDRTYKIHHLSL